MSITNWWVHSQRYCQLNSSYKPAAHGLHWYWFRKIRIPTMTGHKSNPLSTAIVSKIQEPMGRGSYPQPKRWHPRCGQATDLPLVVWMVPLRCCGCGKQGNLADCSADWSSIPEKISKIIWPSNENPGLGWCRIGAHYWMLTIHVRSPIGAWSYSGDSFATRWPCRWVRWMGSAKMELLQWQEAREFWPDLHVFTTVMETPFTWMYT